MDNYVSYQSMVTQVNTSIASLQKACTRLELKEQADSLAELQKRLQNHVFRVGIMGEFKRGKSTVINALLGQEVVPADILPCSATLNRIVWDATPHAMINFKKADNGVQRPSLEISVEDLSNYVTKLTADSEQQASEVEDAVVYYPCSFCQNGVEIVDTPGLNDDERMNYVSESVIPSLDAIIMVLVPGSPFSMSEAAFVRNKIMTSDLGRLIFVVNKIDTVRAKDRTRVVEGIRQKIQETILEKAESMYGIDSKEYNETKTKLGGIRIYPVSSLNALDAKLEGDQEALEKSGMVEFESALSKLLTVERGMLELVGPVGAILSKAKEVENTIQMRVNALNLDKEKFETIQTEAMTRIEQQRTEKKARVRHIKGVAASTYQELMPMVAEAYNALEQTVTAYVDQYPISAANFASENEIQTFQQTLSGHINDQFQMGLQENMEKMQMEIIKRMQAEVDSLEVFNANLSAEINEIRCMIPQASYSGGTSGWDYAAMGLEIATNFTNIIPGLGSAITGFRDHGVLGGLVGLGAGYVSTVAGAYSSLFVLGTLGLGSVAVVPALVIGGVIGAFGGKKITDAIFNFFGKPTQKKSGPAAIKESDLVTIRNQIKQSVCDNVTKMRTEQALEKWLRETTDNTFSGLSARLDHETEQILHGLEETLTQIKIDLANSEVHRTETMRRMKETQDELISVLQQIKPIKDKLDSSLGAAQPVGV